eukprot:1139583-Pelagomonas_calceolata.AAC.2
MDALSGRDSFNPRKKWFLVTESLTFSEMLAKPHLLQSATMDITPRHYHSHSPAKSGLSYLPNLSPWTLQSTARTPSASGRRY